jgi:cytochrome c peroxidase
MKIKSYCAGASLALLALSMTWPMEISAIQGDGGIFHPNPTGVSRTISSAGFVDMTGPFFQDLGTNGRRCVTCHQPAEGWATSVAGIQKRFELSNGLDPIFRLNDGANSPLANVSTVEARRRAYSMLLTRGVIRVERPIPQGAQFDLIAVDDPYGYANASRLSLFRRPLPTTNLRFISTVMWDGREVDPSTPMLISNSSEVNKHILLDSLSHQALSATNGHAEAAQALTLEQRRQIVDFELGLATAQVTDQGAGYLNADGAKGGPEQILGFPFYIGINDNVEDPHGGFDPKAMNLYQSWVGASSPYRAAIARGEVLFNTKPIVISGVKGINDNPYFGSPSAFTGTCTTCHNTPGVGNHSLAVALDIGLTDASRRKPDMPLYTLRHKITHQIISTTDPGLALSTGRWKDVGRFKGPVLRGLASRAPYFHDGSAADLRKVLDFYQDRFGVQFTAQEKADLVAFLLSL